MLAQSVTGDARRRDLGLALADVRTLVRRLSGVRASTRTEQRALEAGRTWSRQPATIRNRRRGARRRRFQGQGRGACASGTRREVGGRGEANRGTLRRGCSRSSPMGRTLGLSRTPPLGSGPPACAEAVDSGRQPGEPRSMRRPPCPTVNARATIFPTKSASSSRARRRRAGHRRERRIVRERLAALDAQADRIELDLLDLATRFCEPLRLLPELGPLFRQLESEATVPA